MENSEIKGLVERCQAGDQAAFGPIYDRYVKKIYDFIYYKTMHRPTAEDLTSQTFFKALNKIKTFKADQGTIQAWLYQIARNTVIDHYRASKAEANIEDIWDLSDQTDIEQDLDISVKLKEVQKYLKKLKPQQREIITLRLWENKSYEEIAEITGLTLINCRVTFSRTISKLREELALVIFYLLLISNQLPWLNL